MDPTAGPSTKSYAEIVKSYKPTHNELAFMHTPAIKQNREQDEEWTDLSSVSSCSWPSDTSDHHSDAAEDYVPNLTSELKDILEDPWEYEKPDTRARNALALKINATHLLHRRYDIPSLGCPIRYDKPWHPFMNCMHKVARKGFVYAPKSTPIKLKHTKRRGMHYDMKEGGTW